MEIKLLNYGKIISNDELGKKIVDEIHLLLKESNKIVIDFLGVQGIRCTTPNKYLENFI